MARVLEDGREREADVQAAVERSRSADDSVIVCRMVFAMAPVCTSSTATPLPYLGHLMALLPSVIEPSVPVRRHVRSATLLLASWSPEYDVGSAPEGKPLFVCDVTVQPCGGTLAEPSSIGPLMNSAASTSAITPSRSSSDMCPCA